VVTSGSLLDHDGVIAHIRRNILVGLSELYVWSIAAVCKTGVLSMMHRRHFVVCSALIGAFLALPAFAAERVEYTAATFDTAQKAGKSVLVEIHAPWCPTCKAQAPILSDLQADPKFKDLVVVHVDFDSQKDAVQRFGARMQSTLITFKGGKETGRSVGDTNRSSLAELLNKAI
jgi:thioredoxin 1